MLYEKILLELLKIKFSNDELATKLKILVKIASAHLILPALYYHIKKINILMHFQVNL